MKKHITLALFILTCAVLHSQNSGPGFAQNTWLVPRTVYVGDPAALILLLPSSGTAAERDSGDTILDAKTLNLSTEDIDINRVVLERSAPGNRLVIEFTAFRPGMIELPLIEIGGESFGGLIVTIDSILDTRDAPQLSGAAPALAMPGTAFMIYGTLAGVVFFIIISIWFFFKGRYVLRRINEKWKRWSLFIFMKNTERNLGRLLAKGENKRKILDKLSDEFRKFLAILTGSSCRSMTAGEFENNPPEIEIQVNKLLTSGVLQNGINLGKFFRFCDNLRFSGTDANNDDIKNLLADLRLFIAAAEKIKPQRAAKEPAA